MKSRSLFRNGRNVNGGCGYDNIPSSIWSPPSWPPSLALVVNWVLHWHPHSEQELGGRHLSDHSSPTKQAVLQRTEQVIDFMGFHKIEIFFFGFWPTTKRGGEETRAANWAFKTTMTWSGCSFVHNIHYYWTYWRLLGSVQKFNCAFSFVSSRTVLCSIFYQDNDSHTPGRLNTLYMVEK